MLCKLLDEALFPDRFDLSVRHICQNRLSDAGAIQRNTFSDHGDHPDRVPGSFYLVDVSCIYAVKLDKMDRLTGIGGKFFDKGARDVDHTVLG